MFDCNVYISYVSVKGIACEMVMVTKSDRWVSTGYSGFLPHEDHRDAKHRCQLAWLI